MHINLFKLVFRTILFLIVGSTAFAVWDYYRCDGPAERCDSKAKTVIGGMLSCVPIFIAWIAPSNDSEKNSLFSPTIELKRPKDPTDPDSED